jgi:hypothetical protein
VLDQFQLDQFRKGGGDEFVTSDRSPPAVVAERDDQVHHNIQHNHVFLRLRRDEDFS